MKIAMMDVDVKDEKITNEIKDTPIADNVSDSKPEEVKTTFNCYNFL